MVISRKGDIPVPNEVMVKESLRVKQPSIKDKTLAAIRNAPDGLTLHEIYVEEPQLTPRIIRLALQDLKIKGEISFNNKCRCHGASIYYVT